MKACIRRFEIPFLLLLLCPVAVFFAEREKSGAFAAVTLFLLFPAFAFFFLRALVLLLRDAYRVKVRGEPWPPDEPSFAERMAALSPQDRATFLLRRLWRVLAVAVGAAIVAKGWTVAGTLLIILGVAPWPEKSP